MTGVNTLPEINNTTDTIKSLIGELKKKGYLENIKCDSNVRVKDILANCEVVG